MSIYTYVCSHVHWYSDNDLMLMYIFILCYISYIDHIINTMYVYTHK